MQLAACPSARRHGLHHLGTSDPPASPVVSEKAFLNLYSDVLEATQDLTGRSPRQSESSAWLLSLLLFMQGLLPLLLPILPARSLSPLRAGTLPRIHARYLLWLSGPSLGVLWGSCAYL